MSEAVKSYDSHVTMAAVATRVQLGRMGIIVTRPAAAKIFREAALAWSEEFKLWRGYEEWLDEYNSEAA